MAKKKVSIATHIEEDLYIRLKIKAAKERRTMVSIIEEALNNLIPASTN